MLTPHTHPYIIHGRSTLKDDCERFWDGPVRELKEKWKTCNEISKLYEPSVNINDEQTMIPIDWKLHSVSCCMEKFKWKFYVLMKTWACILLQKDRTWALWYALSIINEYKKN